MAQYPQGIFQSLQYLLKKVKILALQKQPTYSNISTASAPYVMPGRGIYEITGASASIPIVFPDPALCNGQTITVINTDNLDNQNVSTINQPLQNGSETPVTSINAGYYYIFVSINGIWRGGQIGGIIY